jgi:cholest-4-en-3-one 26-monooxygenase
MLQRPAQPGDGWTTSTICTAADGIRPGRLAPTESRESTARAAAVPPTIDVVSNDAYRHGVPHDQFSWLRANAPVCRMDVPDPVLYSPVWVLSSHQTVLAASKASDHFTVQRRVNLRRPIANRPEDVPRLRHVLNQDDPEHLRLRRIANKGFTPKMVRRFTQYYRQLAAGLLDAAVERETFDFVLDVSSQLPLLAICELIGAPPEDRADLGRWSNVLASPDDSEYADGSDDVFGALGELVRYIDSLAADRRRHPRDDLLSLLVRELDRGELAPMEFYGYVVLLFVAGNETTRNNISHGLLALMEHPDQLALLRDRHRRDEGRLDCAVEEITRWATPVTYMARYCTAPLSIGGEHIQPGERVAMFYCSANRDESVFGPTAPHFDLTRHPNPHLSFGFGTHFCLGAHLARVETRALLEELLPRIDRIELTGPAERVRSSFLNGIKHLPVRITPR